jgi:hypothetical protein
MIWHKIGVVLQGEKKKAIKNIDGEFQGYMIKRHGTSLDELQSLRRVEREVVLGNKPVGVIMLRIFNPDTARERGVNIDSFSSLDRYPDLILYEGHYRNVKGEVMDIKLEKKRGGNGAGERSNNYNQAC